MSKLFDLVAKIKDCTKKMSVAAMRVKIRQSEVYRRVGATLGKAGR
jgi:hypothetical protein